MSIAKDETCIWNPLADGRELRIEIEPGKPLDPNPAVSCEFDRAVDAEWARLCAANPRYYTSPILAVVEADAEAGLLRVRRDEFKRLAVQPAVDTGVVQLGVTGVLVARDDERRPHMLLGKRSCETRVFGGMWELGPSGGVDAPPGSQTTMDWMDVWRALESEMHEEIGLRLDQAPAPPVGILIDPLGSSVELVVRVRLSLPLREIIEIGGGEAGAGAWEYDAVAWVSNEEFPGFGQAEIIVPATRSIWRELISAT